MKCHLVNLALFACTLQISYADTSIEGVLEGLLNNTPKTKQIEVVENGKYEDYTFRITFLPKQAPSHHLDSGPSFLVSVVRNEEMPYKELYINLLSNESSFRSKLLPNTVKHQKGVVSDTYGFDISEDFIEKSFLTIFHSSELSYTIPLNAFPEK